MGKKFKTLIQFFGFSRDNKYWQKKIIKNTKVLRDKIMKETNWLASGTNFGTERYALPFHEQVIKYYEYKNMIIMKRSQYVIIFLTFVLLFFTGWQIYLEFYS